MKENGDNLSENMRGNQEVPGKNQENGEISDLLGQLTLQVVDTNSGESMILSRFPLIGSV